MKNCIKCGIELVVGGNWLYSLMKYKNYTCNNCRKLYYETNKSHIAKVQQLYKLTNKEKIDSQRKLYREKNKEKIKEKNKIYCLKTREQKRLYDKLYREKNKEKIIKYRIEHQEKHKIYNKKYRYSKKHLINNYNKIKYRNNIQYKLTVLLRGRLQKAIKRHQKAGSAISDLGISITDLITHFEQQFKPDMTWENWGSVWQIDHIIPLCSVDLTNREEFLKVCNYKNLRPLYTQENLQKVINDKKLSIKKQYN